MKIPSMSEKKAAMATSAMPLSLPLKLFERLEFLKGDIDKAFAWNDAIREAMNDTELNALMVQHGVSKNDIRGVLSGRLRGTPNAGA